MEISLRGDRELIYSATAEEEGRGNAPTALQFQAYGAAFRGRQPPPRVSEQSERVLEP